MTKNEKGKLDSLDSVLLHIKNNQAIVSGVPALKNATRNLALRVSNIKAAEEFTQKVLTGITTDKNQVKAMLADQFAVNAAQLSAYAFDAGDNELRNDTSITIKNLQRKGQNDIVPQCSHLLALIIAHKQQLAEYGIDDNTITGLQSLLQDFETEKPAYRNARSEKSARVKRRKEEFKAASDLLRFSIDKLMLKLKDSHPEFYYAYRYNRQINKPGNRHTRISGVAAAPGGAPVFQARVTATEVSSGMQYKTNTGIAGDFVLPLTKAGTYRVTATHPDWAAPSEQLVEIRLGDQQSVTLQFSKVV